VITGLHAVLFGPEPRGIQSPASFQVYRVAGLRLDATRVQAAVAALILVAVLALWLRLSLTGKALKAAAANPIGGQAIGIRIPHLFAVTAGIGAACAGCAGVLVAPFFDTQPYLAADYTLLAFITVIVGGLASLPGALIGGLLIGTAEALAAYLVAPSLKSLFSYALLIGVILLRPVGLFGRAGDSH
jgi:branched-chain amino acid transport system permease protein